MSEQETVDSLRQQLRETREQVYKEFEQRLWKAEGQVYELRRQIETRGQTEEREKAELYRLRSRNKELVQMCQRLKNLVQAATDLDAMGEFEDVNPGLGSLG